MNFYVVGGAVRDEILGLEQNDLDFVVTDATQEDMLSLGYTEVGSDFPVFLHPITKDEYALARVERSTGACHKSFEFTCNEVTIEEDLSRRDLTINSIAREVVMGVSGNILITGDLVDPYNGLEDIESRTLRHTTEAFIEDPLRVLRLARLKAKLGSDWVVADETFELCKEVVSEGLLNNLTPERVWMETEKALKTDNFFLYVDFLYDIGFLDTFMPFYAGTRGLSERDDYHPEESLWEHLRLVVNDVKHFKDPLMTLAAFMHDAGKVQAYAESDGKTSGGHDKLGAEILSEWCDTWKVPNKYKKFIVKCARWHSFTHMFYKDAESYPRPKKVLTFMEAFNIMQDNTEFLKFLDICKADHTGRGGDVGYKAYQPKAKLRLLSLRLKNLDSKAVVESCGENKSKIPLAFYKEKCRIIGSWMRDIVKKI